VFNASSSVTVHSLIVDGGLTAPFLYKHLPEWAVFQLAAAQLDRIPTEMD